MGLVKSWIVTAGALGVAIVMPTVCLAEDVESRLGSMLGTPDSISFVGGISGGVNYFGGRHHQEYSAQGGDPDEYVLQPAKHDSGKIQPLFGAFLGVHMRLDERMFVGLEFSGDFTKQKLNTKIDVLPNVPGDKYSLESKLTRDNMYAATLLFGVKLSEGADVYIRAGGIMTKVRSKAVLEGGNPGVGVGGADANTVFTHKRTKNIDGFLVGVGLRGHINENLAVRLEYNYAGFNLPKKVSKQEQSVPGTQDENYQFEKAKLSNQAFLASIEFSF